jgi:phosphoglycolate phosphatase
MLFDIDGTLIKTDGAGRRAMERGFREVFRVDAVSDEVARVPFAGRTDPLIFRDVAAAMGISLDRFEAAWSHLKTVYVEALASEMDRPELAGQILPGVEPLLASLDTMENVHVGLLTGNIEAAARTKLAAFGLERYFSGGGFASDHPNRREIARLAHEKISRSTGITFGARQVVVIGDTEHDVDCARANGFVAVAVESGWSTREKLETAGPDLLLPDLSDTSLLLREIGLID